MAFNYGFYAKMATHVSNNPSVDVVKGCLSYAKTTARTGYTCFALSCMTCCCCSGCGQACLTAGENGANWEKTLNLMYKELTPAQTRVLFLNGMGVLNSILQRLNVASSGLGLQALGTAGRGDSMGYSMTELKRGLINSDIRSGEWIRDVMENVRSYIIAFNRAGTTVSTRYDITISYQEFGYLLACYGIFYPSACKHATFIPSQEELYTLKKAIQFSLENPATATVTAV